MIQAALDKQSQLNRSTRGQWLLYCSHRQELEKLIVPQVPGGRICILGAGNCNDIDLRWLTQAYREVHLIDIDGEALSRAAAFQKVQTSPALRLVGGIDLTGLGDRLWNWTKTPPSEEEIRECTRLANLPPAPSPGTPGEGRGEGLFPDKNADPHPIPLPKYRARGPKHSIPCRKGEEPCISPIGTAGSFDVVLSPCVLSQLLTPLRDTIGEAHTGFVPLLSALRRRHLRLMHWLLAPGGRGVLACDLFSSAIFPQLPRVPREDLPDLMRKMLASGKFFSGLDPASIARAIKTDPLLSADLGGVPAVAPWVWHLGLEKSYLVYAMRFVRGRRQIPGSCQGQT